MDAREKARAERQIESVKQDMLVYKQMVCELKAVLATKKQKKMLEAILMEIRVNEDIIKMMIRSSIPDVPLPPNIELLITVDKNKGENPQQGSKLPRTQSQATAEKPEEETEQPNKKAMSSKPREIPEEAKPEGNRAKNCGICSKGKRTETEETEAKGDKAKNCGAHSKGKGTEPDEEEDDAINHKNQSK